MRSVVEIADAFPKSERPRKMVPLRKRVEKVEMRFVIFIFLQICCIR